MKLRRKKIVGMSKAEKGVIFFIVFAIIVAIFMLVYSSKILFMRGNSISESQDRINRDMGEKMSSLSLTSFDRDLARKFMDKDNDGKCDSCGMNVEICMDSGQLECNMDSSSKIGVLGSEHIHADWKIYVNGKIVDFSDKAHMERMRNNLGVSSFIHVDSGNLLPEKTGDVIHMHASGVPLWIFFESIGMRFDRDCLVLENNKKYCNSDENSLKFYVNGKENNEFENYVFKDLDKILISYWKKDSDLTDELNSITDFAKNH